MFDLDHTLLDGDSDYLWGCFMARQGVVDRDHHERENQRYYQLYQQGLLDIHEYLEFALKPLAAAETLRLLEWRDSFVEQQIRPIIARDTADLLAHHQHRGDTLIIITSTNSFVTRPIADLLGVEHLLATEPEMLGERFSGHVSGTPCFREGKVIRLQQWLAQHRESLEDSWFYSDSHNDLPLLERVTHPVAVEPDAALLARARERGWPVISLNGRAPDAGGKVAKDTDFVDDSTATSKK